MVVILSGIAGGTALLSAVGYGVLQHSRARMGYDPEVDVAEFEEAPTVIADEEEGLEQALDEDEYADY